MLSWAHVLGCRPGTVGIPCFLDPSAAVDISAVRCQQNTGLEPGCFLLLTAELVFKGLIPRSHISAHLGSELWDKVSALFLREILIFL